MERDAALDELHRSLDSRYRPEEVADIILTAFGSDMDGRQRSALEDAARYSWRRTRWYSSMSADYARPVDATRQVATLARLFERDAADLVHAVADPGALLLAVSGAGEVIRRAPGQVDFKRDRLSRDQRAAAGVELGKRQYNRRFRFLARLEAKATRLEVEQRKRELLLVGRIGLAADITRARFGADPAAACFVAYFAARRSARRQFSLSGKDNPYDQVADMLYQRCATNPGTDWWLVSRVYSVPHVVARLSGQEQGELLGRWSSLMRTAAGILESAWDPGVERTKMIVRRGMDSSTWNTMAQAYNTARAGWLSTVATLGAEELLDVACPGKVMRLMAADLAYWHRSSGGDVDPDTAVWAALPLPWEVLSGAVTCTRETVALACDRFGVAAQDRGWTTPRATGQVAAFAPTPELVHGVSIADPTWAGLLRRAGMFSGKRITAGYEDVVVPAGVVVSDLPTKTFPGM